LREAFALANSVLSQGVQSISDLISVPGLINVDFADVRSIMGERGGAVMGVGMGKGENRAEEAVKKACCSPLLDKIEIDGATGVLISVTGPPDLRLAEINTATTMVCKAADPQANIIFGAVVDETLTDEVRVTIIATGFAEDLKRQSQGKRDEDRLTSPTSSLSLRAKLESMLSPGAAAKQAPVVPASQASGPAAQPSVKAVALVEEQVATAACSSSAATSQAQPTPRFPDFTRRTSGSPVAWEPKVAANPKSLGLSVVADGAEEEESDNSLVAPLVGAESDEAIDFDRIPVEARREVSGSERAARQPSSSGYGDLDTPAYLRRGRDLLE
ncbi:hypothetical protein FJY63_14745, partial [Candidatus Sumerlaeota bacterium]|nr:hypothetical protein [Candidatus Sumerlaeota bacterium]